MLKFLYKLILTVLICTIASINSYALGRQRNIIFVLDCTKSMSGYKGNPNIWNTTKAFLKNELDKEAQQNPNAKVMILPFQDKVYSPISVDLNNLAWSRLENVLDGYVSNISGTNICDTWLTAEKYIDQSCDNYIVLMTDGQDNVNKSDRLENILKSFCGKYLNTKGLYIELTQAAVLSSGIQSVIDMCKDIHVVSASHGIPPFGCFSEDIIHINTRDLPEDIAIGFSNSGTFPISIINNNPYVNFSIKDNTISGGKIVLHAESKFDENLNTLNKAINASQIEIPLTLQSDNVIITNPYLNIVLHSTPIRFLSLSDGYYSQINRIKPFLWIKGNDIDTLSWKINPEFNEAAKKDLSEVLFHVKSKKDTSKVMILYNEVPLSSDSTIRINNSGETVIKMLIPKSLEDDSFEFTLNEISSTNLDRINTQRPDNYNFSLIGSYKTNMSLTEIIVWTILVLSLLFLIIWFGFVRDLKYPKFKRGIINVQFPYCATIRVQGCRMVVFASKTGHQGWFDKIWKGRIIYNVNEAWIGKAEVTPLKNNMRFICPSKTLISNPSPIWTKGVFYKITDSNNSSLRIEININ